LPWALTGIAIAALAVLLVLPLLREQGRGSHDQSPQSVAPRGDPTSVDLSSMTPREAADRLFNRVMAGVSAGDSAQARAFLPMALSAYDRVPDLDVDGRYHLTVLHLVNGDPISAREEASFILEAEPDHLFGLYMAAEAEAAMGDMEAARALYTRFLANYDAQINRDLPEYRDHAAVLPANRAEAERILAPG
jgi:uncharacterized membrane-anchored protein